MTERLPTYEEATGRPSSVISSVPISTQDEERVRRLVQESRRNVSG
jgi:hypothetical protein